jgi:hypothetical protein
MFRTSMCRNNKSRRRPGVGDAGEGGVEEEPVNVETDELRLGRGPGSDTRAPP